jgi:hypothetical protein
MSYRRQQVTQVLIMPAEEESSLCFMDPLCLGDIEFFVF